MNKLTIIMYHYTRDLRHSRYPEIRGLDYSLFEQQLRFLKENFHVVTMEQVLEAMSIRGGVPDNAVLLTFDDGYIDNYTVALPLLKKYDLQGSFFIPGKTFSENTVLDVNKIHFILASAPAGIIKEELKSKLDENRNGDYGWIPSNEELYEKHAIYDRYDSRDVMFIKQLLQTVLPEKLRAKIATELFEKYVGMPENYFSRELYMNRDQIRCLKQNGMFIGLHGYDHYWLGNLPKDQMKKDIDRALDVMEEFIDRDAWVMNYPYGNFNEDVIRYISGHGCRLGLTTEVRTAQIGEDDRYQFPRLDCNDFPPKSENYKRIGGKR